MTMKDADLAACMCVPVTYDGNRYERIEKIGYSYGKRGKIPFVVLIGTGGLVQARPQDVEVEK